MRYFIHCTYKGTHFAGWQRQNNAPSVQQSIEEAIELVQKKPVPIMGCGRTDAGVHASEFYFHLDIELEDLTSFQKKLNNILSKDVSINQIIPVHEDAHARFDATLRSYTYYISLEKDPFKKDFHWFYPYGKLNLSLIHI